MLCASEANAQEEVAHCDRDWRAHGPHRAVQLGDVAAERELRHDLARAFKKLDAGGFIQSYGEEGDDECAHWLGIAREACAK